MKRKEILAAREAVKQGEIVKLLDRGYTITIQAQKNINGILHDPSVVTPDIFIDGVHVHKLPYTHAYFKRKIISNDEVIQCIAHRFKSNSIHELYAADLDNSIQISNTPSKKLRLRVSTKKSNLESQSTIFSSKAKFFTDPEIKEKQACKDKRQKQWDKTHSKRIKGLYPFKKTKEKVVSMSTTLVCIKDTDNVIHRVTRSIANSIHEKGGTYCTKNEWREYVKTNPKIVPTPPESNRKRYRLTMGKCNKIKGVPSTKETVTLKYQHNKETINVDDKGNPTKQFIETVIPEQEFNGKIVPERIEMKWVEMPLVVTDNIQLTKANFENKDNPPTIDFIKKITRRNPIKHTDTPTSLIDVNKLLKKVSNKPEKPIWKPNIKRKIQVDLGNGTKDMIYLPKSISGKRVKKYIANLKPNAIIISKIYRTQPATTNKKWKCPMPKR